MYYRGGPIEEHTGSVPTYTCLYSPSNADGKEIVVILSNAGHWQNVHRGSSIPVFSGLRTDHVGEIKMGPECHLSGKAYFGFGARPRVRGSSNSVFKPSKHSVFIDLLDVPNRYLATIYAANWENIFPAIELSLHHAACGLPMDIPASRKFSRAAT
ncbi:hypothetical protein C8J57DRAFT_1213737 [Mycena rebaudengoi]|nr:hypothetical protein C8J57DRAFT_1213737 [Mycena rebaudengoi]